MKNIVNAIDRDSVNCWIIFEKPFDEPERSNKDIILPYQKLCIEKNIFGMGWSLDTDSIPYGTSLTSETRRIYTEEYKEYCKKHNFISQPSNKALNFYEIMKSGDIAIQRMMNGHYCIGRLATGAIYLNKKEMPYKELSWGCEVEKWYEIKNEMELPAGIRGRFSQSHLGTVQHVVNEIKPLIISLYEFMAYGKISAPAIHLTQENFAKYLDYNELEDLVFLHMWDRHKNEGYVMLPSSCKVNQPIYEFYLTKGSDDNIAYQVKNRNDAPSPHEYEDDQHLRLIYVFSGLWNEENALNYQKLAINAGAKNVRAILPSDLFQTLQNHRNLFVDKYRRL